MMRECSPHNYRIFFKNGIPEIWQVMAKSKEFIHFSKVIACVKNKPICNYSEYISIPNGK